MIDGWLSGVAKAAYITHVRMKVLYELSLRTRLRTNEVLETRVYNLDPAFRVLIKDKFEKRGMKRTHFGEWPRMAENEWLRMTRNENAQECPGMTMARTFCSPS